MKSIVLLSTDIPHHRYFIARLRQLGLTFSTIIFETSSVSAPFDTGPFYKEEEQAYEEEMFFKHVPPDISEEKVYHVVNINEQRTLDILSKTQSTLGVVFGTRKLSLDVINSLPDGFLNIHRGISQNYRGLDSDLWAIYHSDLESIGVTLHKVDSQLDTGDIVYQEKVKLPDCTKIFHLRYLTTIAATEMSYRALKDYFNDGLLTFPQEKKGRYYSFMPLCIKQTLVQKFARLIKRCRTN